MKFKYNDGGRKDAGYKGITGDCVVRAISIATQKPYQEIYDIFNELGNCEKITKRKRGKSSSRTGVYRKTYNKYLLDNGWKWTPTMFIGQGCKVHLKEDELPSGILIVRLTRHIACVIDGVLNDISDCSRGGTRCVYGYYSK